MLADGGNFARAGRRSSISMSQSVGGSPLKSSQLAQVLRAAIISGAALYNSNDFDGCLRLFKQTAESVIAATGAAAVKVALQQASSIHKTMQERIWALRCSFDELLDEWGAGVTTST